MFYCRALLGLSNRFVFQALWITVMDCELEKPGAQKGTKCPRCNPYCAVNHWSDKEQAYKFLHKSYIWAPAPRHNSPIGHRRLVSIPPVGIALYSDRAVPSLRKTLKRMPEKSLKNNHAIVGMLLKPAGWPAGLPARAGWSLCRHQLVSMLVYEFHEFHQALGRKCLTGWTS